MKVISVRFIIAMTKRPDKRQEQCREGIVYSALQFQRFSLLLWVSGEAKHHGKRAWERNAAQDDSQEVEGALLMRNKYKL